MSEKALKEIPSAFHPVYQKGSAALEKGDFTDAIRIFNHVLDEEPGFVDCREALRKAQLGRDQNQTGSLKKLFNSTSETRLLPQAEIQLDSQPLKAVQLAERVLNHLPSNVAAHRILALAALKVNMPRTALLSFDFIRVHCPENVPVILELAVALAQNGQAARAMDICGGLLKEHPDDRRITRVLSEINKYDHNGKTHPELASTKI